jgi:hypothetical protein
MSEKKRKKTEGIPGMLLRSNIIFCAYVLTGWGVLWIWEFLKGPKKK